MGTLANVRDIRKLDDDTERARIQLAAKGGDDHASALLFFWAQWHKINTTKYLPTRKKVLLLADFMATTHKNFKLTFTYV